MAWLPHTSGHVCNNCGAHVCMHSFLSLGTKQQTVCRSHTNHFLTLIWGKEENSNKNMYKNLQFLHDLSSHFEKSARNMTWQKMQKDAWVQSFMRYQSINYQIQATLYTGGLLWTAVDDCAICTLYHIDYCGVLQGTPKASHARR